MNSASSWTLSCCLSFATKLAPMLDSELKTRMFEVAGLEAEALLISILSCERGRLNGWPE